jgi:hypothetical protein
VRATTVSYDVEGDSNKREVLTGRNLEKREKYSGWDGGLFFKLLQLSGTTPPPPVTRYLQGYAAFQGFKTVKEIRIGLLTLTDAFQLEI